MQQVLRQNKSGLIDGANSVMAHDHRKRLGIILGFAILLGIAVLSSVAIGTIPLDFWSALAIIQGQGNDMLVSQVIQNIRLPRILTGMLVGMNLAVAGALLQGMLRNPLADPHIIGVNAGAACMAVVIMVLAPHLINLLPPAAFAGALLATILVYLLSQRAQGNTNTNIILGGVAIAALLSAFTSALMLVFSDELEVTYTWLIGGLTGRGWSYFRTVLPYSLVALPLAVFISPRINLFHLGDEVGSSLGLSVKFFRILIILTAAVLAGSAVSVAGTIGFIGIIAPHLARLLVGNDYRYMVILSAVIGGLLVIVADILARTIFQPVELPVGIFTAILGVPFFFYLMNRKKYPG